ncbi:hypothetical protein [Mariniphaga sp.]|uniref:hypothetical protein n=1 Tax=Mariniphaga sp. TaxID=1954475 RepID=UPI00356A9744
MPDFFCAMGKNIKICFVCKKPLSEKNFEINQEVYLPVCLECKGTDAEKKTVEEYLDSLADGLVCGCI